MGERDGPATEMSVLTHALRGQAMVEFALAFLAFALLLFGILQAVLIYQAQSALNQAATDATHVLAAQSTNGAPNGQSTQADLLGLQAIRHDLVAESLTNIVQIQFFSADSNNQPQYASNGVTTGITESVDLTDVPTIPLTFTLQNDYVYGAAPTTPVCPVDVFYLSDPATQISSDFTQCALPWNGSEWNSATNQNGRHDQRCDEEMLGVRITYHYLSTTFPVHYDLTLTGFATAPIEPRRYLQNAASQAMIGVCP